MNLARRITALVLGLLLLQLTLAESAFACIEGVRIAAETSAPALRGAGHDMSAHAMAESHAMPRQDRNTDPCPSPADQRECPAGEDGAACPAMSACAPSMMTPASLIVDVVERTPTHARTTVLIAPATRTTAPELPPPRA